MSDMTLQADGGQAIPYKKEKPVIVFSFCTRARNAIKASIAILKTLSKSEIQNLSEPHKKSTAEIFFSSMSRTISPDLKLNLSFYVDSASDFEINPISKK